MFYTSDSWGKALRFVAADAATESPKSVFLVAPTIDRAKERLAQAIAFLGLDPSTAKQHNETCFRTDQIVLRATSSFAHKEARGVRITHVLIEDADHIAGLEAAAHAETRAIVFIHEPSVIEDQLGKKLLRDGLTPIMPLEGESTPDCIFKSASTLLPPPVRGHANE